VIGLTVNTGVISVFLFGVFVKPVTDDLGISRVRSARAHRIVDLHRDRHAALRKAIDHFGIRASICR